MMSSWKPNPANKQQTPVSNFSRFIMEKRACANPAPGDNNNNNKHIFTARPKVIPSTCHPFSI
jgi:hypothetical protein